jgi:hypothetical protein
MSFHKHLSNKTILLIRVADFVPPPTVEMCIG